MGLEGLRSVALVIFGRVVSDIHTEGTDEHLVHITTISVSPDPPQRGKDLTITVEGVADDNVEVRVSLATCDIRI